MKRMNNILSFIFGTLTEFLSQKWHGLIGLLGTAAGTVGIKETNDYMRAITENGDYVKLYHTNEIQYYSDNDSLRHVIDSLQNLNSIGKAIEVHNNITVFQYMQYALLFITLILGICTLIGNLNKFIGWIKGKRANRVKLTDWDDE